MIHCIGDSHVSFFSGYDRIQPEYPENSINKYPFFRVYRLGAVLAFNLNKLNTREQGREKLLRLITELPLHADLLLCYGEIDCRCHLVKQAELKRKQLFEIIEECIKNYFEVVDELIHAGFKVIIWNVVPTSDSQNINYPTYGSHLQRNICTKMFNKYLEGACRERGIIFLSIFEKLITKELQTKSVFYFDAIHLGQNAMPIVLRQLTKLKPIFSNGIINRINLLIQILIAKIKIARITIYRLAKQKLRKIKHK